MMYAYLAPKSSSGGKKEVFSCPLGNAEPNQSSAPFGFSYPAERLCVGNRRTEEERGNRGDQSDRRREGGHDPDLGRPEPGHPGDGRSRQPRSRRPGEDT